MKLTLRMRCNAKVKQEVERLPEKRYDGNGGKRERRRRTTTTQLLLCSLQDVNVALDFLLRPQLFLPCA
jgi:hypothetical protein